MITNQLSRAQKSVTSGVNLIFIDMETLGKEERQKGRGAVFNSHSFEDVANLSQGLQDPKENLLVRINPYHNGSSEEIEKVLESDIALIMLPYFKTLDEIRVIKSLIAGRAKLCLLFETIDSLDLIDQIHQEGLCEQVHFGLNDLSIEMGYKCIFKVLFDDRFIQAVSIARSNDITFGIGGVGKIGQHEIPAELLLREYLRLGSDFVILSRAFNSEDLWEQEGAFKYELDRINQLVDDYKKLSKNEKEQFRVQLLNLLENKE